MKKKPAIGIEELVEFWTLLDDERDMVDSRRGATKLGFALLLKFYSRHGRFPRGRSEFPSEIVSFVARQVKVPPSEFGLYEWTGRTIEDHRRKIRDHLGFRVCGTIDAEKLTVWLAENVAHAELRADRIRAELLARCFTERIEPPSGSTGSWPRPSIAPSWRGSRSSPRAWARPRSAGCCF